MFILFSFLILLLSLAQGPFLVVLFQAQFKANVHGFSFSSAATHQACMLPSPAASIRATTGMAFSFSYAWQGPTDLRKSRLCSLTMPAGLLPLSPHLCSLTMPPSAKLCNAPSSSSSYFCRSQHANEHGQLSCFSFPMRGTSLPPIFRQLAHLHVCVSMSKQQLMHP